MADRSVNMAAEFGNLVAQALRKEQKQAAGGHHSKDMSEELEDHVDEMRSECQEVK